jgi:hypothetical protein
MAPPIAATAADVLADAPYTKSYLAQDEVIKLADELLFQRAVQTYLWALPALNMYAMKEGSEAKFGKGYNVLPVFKKRLNAKTLITTPNSDVIYALGYLDLKEDGPMVIEVPPGLQGILDDFFQRLQAAIVHVRSGHRNVAQHWRLERAAIAQDLGDAKTARVHLLAGARADADVVKGKVRKAMPAVTGAAMTFVEKDLHAALHGFGQRLFVSCLEAIIGSVAGKNRPFKSGD